MRRGLNFTLLLHHFNSHLHPIRSSKLHTKMTTYQNVALLGVSELTFIVNCEHVLMIS